jgi:hypothetical protein
VLELGRVPLPVVTARIDRFIAEGGKGPYPDMEVSRSRVFWDPVGETITTPQSKTRGGELPIDPRFQNRERHAVSSVC